MSLLKRLVNIVKHGDPEAEPKLEPVLMTDAKTAQHVPEGWFQNAPLDQVRAHEHCVGRGVACEGPNCPVKYWDRHHYPQQHPVRNGGRLPTGNQVRRRY